MKTRVFLMLFVVLLVGAIPVLADVRLPKLFAEGMVLQRDQPISVWGWAEPGERVMVRLNGRQQATITDNQGRWLLRLQPEKAGGPYTLTVNGLNEIVFDDIWIGDVWICSGQSNMRWQVAASANATEEIANANFPKIRQVIIPRKMYGSPQEDVDTVVTWRTATPEYVGAFTAVGYFFARNLHRDLQVPIGLINTVWGGTRLESWLSEEAMESDEELGKAIPVLKQVEADSILNNKNPNKYPTLLYNAMIHPLIPFAVKGVIWYQGEANTERAFQYRKAFPLLISDWRQRWGLGDFPFYFVQLSSFNAKGGNSAKGSTWAELREAQDQTLSLPNTGQAITIDIGMSKDIHPRNKQDVGKRLAAIALNKTYGRRNVYSGPVYKKHKIKGRHVELSFDHVHKGLAVKQQQDTLGGFEVAGADQRFFPATAVIKKNKVILYSAEVNAPVAVRYGWADDAGACTLMNKDGFPAAPFRTDDWPMLTRDKLYEFKNPAQK